MNEAKPLLLAGLLCLCAWHLGRTSAPAPEVVPVVEGLDLRGKFIGENAAHDAVMLSALSDELAAELEFDGQQAVPGITTGRQVEQLRTLAREGRMRGESLGARQPKARQAIGDYMTQRLGISPGELTNRAEWVRVFRDISRACANAIK